MDFSDLPALDAADPLARFRDAFDLPGDVVYLAGNSLGALPKAAAARLDATVREEWGRALVHGWTEHDWIGAPERVGGKIARLIGAGTDEVVAADSTSVDLYKLIAAAMAAAPERRTLLGVQGEFPTDLYVAHGAVQTLGGGRRLRLVERGDLEGALDGDVALLLLSHSTGVTEVDLSGAEADLAVGCGYKYLNGGPGAPAYLFVARRHQDHLASPLSGWMGHARPFDFADGYAPAQGVRRFLCGTPPILSLTALEAGVDLMLQANPAILAGKARRLGDVFLELAARHCPGLQPACPGPGRLRGGHVAFRHPEAAKVSEALAGLGVIGDVRPPDLLRFGLSPLYVSYGDVGRAVQALAAAI